MRPRVMQIYNPVDVSDAPNETNSTDPNKLVFSFPTQRLGLRTGGLLLLAFEKRRLPTIHR